MGVGHQVGRFSVQRKQGGNQVTNWGKAALRTGTAALLVVSLSTASLGSVMAKSSQTGSGDNGGNGEGTLLIYGSDSNALSGTSQLATLVPGQTYYFTLANPGGKTSEKNLKSKYVPTNLMFNFYSPVHNFQGNPKKAQKYQADIQYSPIGAEVSTHPYVFSVKLPAKMAAGDYTIATFGTNLQPQSGGKNGEDEFFFSTDPTVNGNKTSGSDQVVVAPATQNNMPEVPWAGALPVGLAGLGAAAWMIARRKRPSAR